VSPKGRIKWIRAIGRTAYDAAGQPVRFDRVTREITALKDAEEARDRAKEALMRSEKLALVGRLAATVAHEINNPLAAVTNLLYLIEQSLTDALTLGYVKMAMEEVDHRSALVLVKPSERECPDLFKCLRRGAQLAHGSQKAAHYSSQTSSCASTPATSA